MYSCTSGTISSRRRIIFQSPQGIICRFEWMKSLISQFPIKNITSFATTGFIDCLTVLLDAILLHRCLVIPSYQSFCRPSSLYSILSSQQPGEFLLRTTPSLLTTICKGHSPLNVMMSIHLSGELLGVKTLKTLKAAFPEAQFLNIYGGRYTVMIMILKRLICIYVHTQIVLLRVLAYF